MVAIILQVLGGVIIAICIFRALGEIDCFGVEAAFETFLQGLVFGMLFIGFGRVIKLLENE